MKKSVFLYNLLGFLILLISCGDESDRQEVVNKIRAIGVKFEPGIIAASADQKPVTTNWTLYALLPKDKNITAEEIFADPQAKPLTAKLSITSPNENPYIDFGPLKLYSLRGTAELAPVSSDILARNKNVLRASYGLSLSENSDVEKVVGDILLVSPDSAFLAYKSPEVSILTPDSLPYAKEIDLEAAITKLQEENIKVGWFVSSGKIKNRRAKKTTWEPESAGEYTICVALYGSKSRLFNFAIKKIILR